MDLGFRGEVADFYHRYRRGYPPPVVHALAAAFGLTADDLVVDLGCGTGQLTLPMATRVRAAIGVDPEPDMLARARAAAAEQEAANVTWLVGADTDMTAVRAVLGDGSVGAVTIGQALHWMDHEQLFPALFPLVRSGGGVAVVTNGLPLWLQDAPWSQALRTCLEQWLGHEPTRTCGTDEAAQQRYRRSLADTGFEVATTAVEYTDGLTTEQIIGGVYSALPVNLLPEPDQRPLFAQHVHRALDEYQPITEHVRVGIITARR